MNCIIIDDEEMARTIVGQLANSNSNVTILESFSNAIEAIKFLNENTIDLVFLDIHMPTFTGFDFIRTIKDPPKIILTTSDRNFAIEAFEYPCIVDYFVKPITQERFDKGIQKALIFNAEPSNTVDNNPVSTDTVNDLYINIDRRLIG